MKMLNVNDGQSKSTIYDHFASGVALEEVIRD